MATATPPFSPERIDDAVETRIAEVDRVLSECRRLDIDPIEALKAFIEEHRSCSR